MSNHTLPPVDPPSSPSEVVETVDTTSLERLIGYNARRAALSVIGQVFKGMERFGLQGPIDYSVLNLIAHNPGVTSRQLCHALDILPPNLVGLVKAQEKRGWIEKHEHPTDRRAQGLYLTEAGRSLHDEAEFAIAEIEVQASQQLTPIEREILISLLRKLYAKAS